MRQFKNLGFLSVLCVLFIDALVFIQLSSLQWGRSGEAHGDSSGYSEQVHCVLCSNAWGPGCAHRMGVLLCAGGRQEALPPTGERFAVKVGTVV